MYEREMCVTADKIYILDKSVINTRTKRGSFLTVFFCCLSCLKRLKIYLF